MSRADTLVSRLRGIRERGIGRWVALCPAHEDRRPSLAVRETADGRVLVHCFAGCPTDEVLASLGLGMNSLFPTDQRGDGVGRERVPFPAADVLAAVLNEMSIVVVAALNVANGVALDDADRGRVLVAAERIRRAAELAEVR